MQLTAYDRVTHLGDPYHGTYVVHPDDIRSVIDPYGNRCGSTLQPFFRWQVQCIPNK